MIFFVSSELKDEFPRVNGNACVPLPPITTPADYKTVSYLFIFIYCRHFSQVVDKYFDCRTLKIHLPYNLMLLSTSPREFFAIHLYDPKSYFSTDFMVSTIWSSNMDLIVLFVWYLSLVITISPTRKKML